MSLIVLPLAFLQYWFMDAPIVIARFFLKLNKALVRFLSIDLLSKTYFKPIKNEYREGLVAFSVGMGMVIKTPLILFGVAVLFAFSVAESLILMAWLLLPIVTIAGIFIHL